MAFLCANILQIMNHSRENWPACVWMDIVRKTKGETNMCRAIEGIKEDERKKGFEEGLQKGFEKGFEKANARAEKAEREVERLKKLLEEAKAAGAAI